jgi:uncharacterized protein with HEPN domain
LREQSERLIDILEAIERIERYASLGQERFKTDELVQIWIVHHIEIIGEAAARLGAGFHSKYPLVPWVEIVAMRNILIHEYFGVDPDEIWQVAMRDLPRLKRQLETILSAEKEPPKQTTP